MAKARITKFKIHGPFTIHLKERGRGFRLLYADFWKGAHEQKAYAKKKRGLYLWHSCGKRDDTDLCGACNENLFQHQCFNPTNQKKYREGIRKYKRCTPVLLLIVHPKQKGRLNSTAIDQIESFFVQLCAEKNEKLQNLRKRKVPRWGIEGVIRCSRRGPRKDPEIALVTMAGLKS